MWGPVCYLASQTGRRLFVGAVQASPGRRYARSQIFPSPRRLQPSGTHVVGVRERKRRRCAAPGSCRALGCSSCGTSHREEPTSPGEDTPRNASLRSLRSTCHRERARGSWHRIHVSLHILDFQTREAEVIFVCVTIFQDWEFQFFDHSVSLTPTFAHRLRKLLELISCCSVCAFILWIRSRPLSCMTSMP